MNYWFIAAGVAVPVLGYLYWLTRVHKSTYRHTIRDGVLIRETRGMIFRWRWSFNKSEEDQLTTLRNQMVAIKDQLRKLQRQIPKVEVRLAERKKELAEKHGGTSPPWVDLWTPRREPVQIKEPDGKKKKPDEKAKRKPHPDEGVIAKLTTVR